MSKFKEGDKVYTIFTVLDPCDWVHDEYGPVVSLGSMDDVVALYEKELFPLTPAMKKELNKGRKKDLQNQIKNLQKELDSLD